MITTQNINTDITLKPRSFSLIDYINKKIQQEEKNGIGIAVILIMVSTMIASFSAALAIHKQINIIPLAFTCISAMGANAVAISQRPFKYIAWAFIISIVGNIGMIIYQLALLAI
ncbi:hypothetical protein WH52_02200 [Tenacibaculum holothuriorum]|uniref:Uncharacterized protein n=1 Tax=Tenacibaculum holothuriorum TaxID=1635173 RepID=A0A1Y2PI43_9FLAO|nr:hypothetical protein [Tenacibaculum holothuriorum]OSY89467.1 hypothetical protein WH52_02200 [Tenacibaculum holothuriorum]